MRLHDRSVRQDVRELGRLVGDVIRDQASDEDFERVERLRTTAIEYRDDERGSRTELFETIQNLDDESAAIVARAFTTYFELINLAEERQRVRSIRSDSQEGTLENSLEAAAAALAETDRDRVDRILDDVRVEPTFTAHPTEARRKTVKSKLRTVATHLETLDERRLTDKERAQVERAIAAEVGSLWQTPQVRHRPPEPIDEARNVLWYLENTLFDVVGEVYDELERALEAEFDDPPSIPSLLSFRSWAGSDRDGNPHVTPDVTETTLKRQRAVVIDLYHEELARLSGILSQDGARIDVGDAFRESLAADRTRLPAVATAAEERYPEEPYRQKLGLMRERLQRVGDVRPGGYEDSSSVLADLDVLAASLRANGGDDVAETHVDPLRRRVETFGFSLASLDLRDHRENHTAAVVAGFDYARIDYAAMDEAERVEVLSDAILQDEPVLDPGRLRDDESMPDVARRVFERFDRLADWQREFGVSAIDTYCISMTEKPSHVLEVLFLADQAGVVSLPDHAGLDVVPLLETESALSNSRRIMATLFENEAYAAALSVRDDVQEVMLGYSDSSKENGYLAANWDLYVNQKRLAEIAEEYDLTLRLFHGRGGSISRGGGPMNRSLLALPPESVTGPVKFTEQGEAIAEKYANPRIAEREVEQMLHAQLLSRRRALSKEPEGIPREWIDAMDRMAETAGTEYRDLLDTDGFVAYYEQSTPIAIIESLNLGSRPASRTGERTVEDLRAIPWVFAWTQARCIVPGWYSLGTGIEAYLEGDGDLETLRDMYEEWPFFRTTIDNAANALARTEMDIAAEYANLAEPGLRERLFPRIEAEYERSVGHVLDVTARSTLVDREWFRENLRRRNPYVDPLNLLQIHLLSKSDRTELEAQTLRLTVKGIAAGMKNTG